MLAELNLADCHEKSYRVCSRMIDSGLLLQRSAHALQNSMHKLKLTLTLTLTLTDTGGAVLTLMLEVFTLHGNNGHLR